MFYGVRKQRAWKNQDMSSDLREQVSVYVVVIIYSCQRVKLSPEKRLKLYQLSRDETKVSQRAGDFILLILVSVCLDVIEGECCL